ncbi:molecular chaperone TorD family protein [Roseibium salinum]|nr:molecular chaperone TorD family protein [Roseibium salinum]
MPAVAREFIINPEDQARSELYDFLGLVLARPADAALLGQIAGLRGDDTPLGNALDLLAKIAAVTRAETAEREFNALFIGLGRGELLPYASYYLTGFLNEKNHWRDSGRTWRSAGSSVPRASTNRRTTSPR